MSLSSLYPDVKDISIFQPYELTFVSNENLNFFYGQFQFYSKNQLLEFSYLSGFPVHNITSNMWKRT